MSALHKLKKVLAVCIYFYLNVAISSSSNAEYCLKSKEIQANLANAVLTGLSIMLLKWVY